MCDEAQSYNRSFSSFHITMEEQTRLPLTGPPNHIIDKNHIRRQYILINIISSRSYGLERN